jgi:predicted extracellular nuclease
MKKWIVGLMCVGMAATAAMDAMGGLIISQYYEGASNDKWIEIYNAGAEAVDLTAGGYRLGLWANVANREGWKTGVAPNAQTNLSGTLAAGATFLVKHGSAALPSYAVADIASSAVANFNGDDSVVLYTGSTFAFANVVDAFGLTGSNALNRSFSRKTSVTTGVNTDFNAADWDEFSNAAVDAAAIGTNERLGYHSTGAAVFSVSLNRSNGFTVEEGTSDSITATAANGTAPYGYVWTTDLDGVHYTDIDNVFTILDTAEVGDYYAAVVATDDTSATASNSVTFSVVAPAPKYAISITAPVNGTVTTTPADEAEEGQLVTINANGDSGYAVDTITVVDEGMNPVSVTLPARTFTMPASAVTVTVTFQEASTSGELIISQYYEGASNNKWIEIYNPSSGTVDLPGGSYRLGQWNGTNREGWKMGYPPSSSIALSNSIAAGATFLVMNNSAVLPAYAVANQMGGTTVMGFNGDDSMVLYTGTPFEFANVVDAVGLTGNTAVDTSYVRKETITAGVNTDFNAPDWDVFTLTQVEEAGSTANEYLGYHSTGAPVFGVSLNKSNGFVVEEGTSDAITATAANGTAPYGYAWETTMGVGDYSTNGNVFTILATAPVGSYSATVVATDDTARRRRIR